MTHKQSYNCDLPEVDVEDEDGDGDGQRDQYHGE